MSETEKTEAKEELDLSPLYGRNPSKKACTTCRKPVGESVDLGRMWHWLCLECRTPLIAKFANHCKKCGNDDFLRFRRLTEFDGSKTMVPMGLCKTCQKEKDDYEAAMAAGAYSWKCEDCGSEGYFPLDSEMHRQLFDQYGDKIKGINLTKKKCLMCNARKNEEKRKRRSKR